MNPSERIDDKEVGEAVLVTMLLFSNGEYSQKSIALDTGRYFASIRPYEKDEIPNTIESIKGLEEKGIIEELPDGWHRNSTDPIVCFSIGEENRR